MSVTELIAAIATIEREQLPALLTAIAARLAEPTSKPVDDDLIDVSDAARMLGVSESYLYHAKRLKYAVNVGKRRMFSRTGIQTFIQKQQGKN